MVWRHSMVSSARCERVRKFRLDATESLKKNSDVQWHFLTAPGADLVRCSGWLLPVALAALGLRICRIFHCNSALVSYHGLQSKQDAAHSKPQERQDFVLL